MGRAESMEGWEKLSEPSGYLHTWSGLFFPSRIEALKQLAPMSYEPGGRNSAIGYNGPQHRLAITVYIYPKYADSMELILSDELHQIRRAHPGMSIEMAGPMTMPFAGADGVPDTYGAYLTYDLDKVELGSLLELIPVDDKLVKVRATWVRSDQGLEYSMAQVRALLSRVSRATK
jgi:hypothetical protein